MVDQFAAATSLAFGPVVEVTASIVEWSPVFSPHLRESCLM